MANNAIIKFDELAPCGVFCGACPSFGKSCFGCASENKNQKRKSKWACKIRLCCYKTKSFDFCISCNDYPCKIYAQKLLNTHKNDPRFNYRHELPKIFKELKKKGLEEYYSFQKERWKCKECGGTIRFYTYLCDKCGNYKWVN